MGVLESTYAGLCRLNQASPGLDSQLSRENGVGDETQFGIIRKAALYAGHGPATVKLFMDLWDQKK
jgi:hypothetical protein